MDVQPIEIERNSQTGLWYRTVPTLHLRWSRGGVLQQAWVRTTFDANDSAIAERHEWRDVPTEKE